MILPIYIYGQPVLKKRAKPVLSMDAEITQLVENMFETVRNAHGIGLAANQVGSHRRTIVVDISEMEEGKNIPPVALLNPEVVSEEGKWVMEEGCLSIPEIRDDVERAERIRVRYRDMDFQIQEMDAEGLLARVLLHEIDHLNGVLFIDHLSAVKRKLLKGRLNKIKRGEIEVAYPVLTEVMSTIEAMR
jgi:peptide deformylase